MLTTRVSIVAAVLIAGVVRGEFQAPPAPSLLIVNARVFTGVADRPWAEAIAIAGERVLSTGASAALKAGATSATRVVDANGRLVIPGLNDAHVHVGASPVATRLEGPPAMEQDPSLQDIVTRLKVAVGKAPAGGWIFGEIGARVLDDADATRFVLDAVAPSHPVVLTAWTGHGSLLNTTALSRLNVREDEPDPPGGLFGRIPGTTTISGVAQEYAGYMIWQRLAAMTDENTLVATLQSAAPRLARYGITSIQAMLTGQTAAVLAKGIAAAGVPLRWRLIDFPFQPMADWRQPQARPSDAGLITASGTKWILDGTPVERLMSVRQPYADRPTTRGRLNFPPAAVNSFLRAALAAREQPLFHAVGDAAIDAVLDALEASGGEKWRPLRPRIEHGDMLEPAHFDRLKRFGIVVVQNPSHFMLPDVMKARLGDRVGRITMMRSLIAADVPVALGSDGPPNPYLNMMFAITNANNPAEAMTREQVLAAYTMGSAYAEREDAEKGTLAPGKLADLAILSQDILTVPAERLPATESILTVVGGRIVYEAK